MGNAIYFTLIFLVIYTGSSIKAGRLLYKPSDLFGVDDADVKTERKEVKHNESKKAA